MAAVYLTDIRIWNDNKLKTASWLTQAGSRVPHGDVNLLLHFNKPATHPKIHRVNVSNIKEGLDLQFIKHTNSS